MKSLLWFAILILLIAMSSCKKKDETAKGASTTNTTTNPDSIPSDIYGTYYGDAACTGSHGDAFGDKIIISVRSSETVWFWHQVDALNGFTLIMNVDGDSLKIDSQVAGNVTYSGSGIYTSGDIFMTLNASYQGGAYSCNYAHSK